MIVGFSKIAYAAIFYFMGHTVVTIATWTPWFEEGESGHIIAMLNVTFTSPHI